MTRTKSSSGSPLVHDLAGDVKLGHDKAMTHDMADMAGEVTARVRQAAEIVAAKAPTDLQAFKAFILGIAQATAEAPAWRVDSPCSARVRVRRAEADGAPAQRHAVVQQILAPAR